MRFQVFTKYLEALENTSGRIEMYGLLGEVQVDEMPARMDSRMKTDVWVEPKIVVTLHADEITRSPLHTAGRDKDGRGLALRFPRIVGFVRADKSAEEATTVLEIEQMYAQQRNTQKSSAK